MFLLLFWWTCLQGSTGLKIVSYFFCFSYVYMGCCSLTVLSMQAHSCFLSCLFIYFQACELLFPIQAPFICGISKIQIYQAKSKRWTNVCSNLARFHVWETMDAFQRLTAVIFFLSYSTEQALAFHFELFRPYCMWQNIYFQMGFVVHTSLILQSRCCFRSNVEDETSSFFLTQFGTYFEMAFPVQHIECFSLVPVG